MYSTRALGIAGTAAAFLALTPALAASAGSDHELDDHGRDGPVLEGRAVLAAPVPPSRRDEWPAVEATLRPFRPMVRLPLAAGLEGRRNQVARIRRAGERRVAALPARTAVPYP